MQEQRFVASNSVTDPVTGIRYELGADGIQLSKQGSGLKLYPISTLSSEPRKKNSRFYLRFVRKNQGLISVSPQGTLLTCKSDRIQEVDLNITLDRGQVWWEFFVPHTTLFLTVGVKDTKTNLISAFDYCLKHSTKLQFKLNVDNLSFKTWINGVPSQAKPAFVLQKGHEWTPFVRVREIGTSLAVSSLIADPDNIASEYNPFHTAADVELGTEAHRIEDVEQLAFEHNAKMKSIQLIGDHSLLLSGESDIRLIRRSKSNHTFNVDGLLHKTKTNQGDSERYLMEITKQQLDLLLKSEQVWGTSIIGVVLRHNSQLWLSKTKEEWAQWTKAVCLFLDKRLRDNSTHQLATLIYRWVLSKVQSLRAILDDLLKINELNSFDSDLINAIDRNTFNQRRNVSLPIEPSNYINNISYHTFSQPILGNTSSQHYIFFRFASNKISVFSIRNSLFKIGDFIISKAIKKENEINQFKKEAEDIKENDFTKPSIYKILKNCLKYADKVKPPEKLIKELEQKKALIKEKEKVEVKKVENELVPDKQLQNTLIQMGFDINIARKALTQCKNSSLQAAMDLILSGNLKVEPVTKVEAPKRQWTCQTCTLVNAGNIAICAACDSPAPPIEMLEEKKEIVEQVKPVIEEQIKSEKIQEQLKEVYPFQTNIGFIPLVVGGVFSTQLRFRLFCLNPRFYSSFYDKGDAYANLIDNTLNEYSHQITTKQIQDLSFSYYDQAELKERYFAWIPIEDYDMSAENVRSIRYEVLGFDKENFSFKAFITYPDKTSCLTFNINTSNVYLEKQRSLTLVKEEQVEEIISKAVEAQQPEQIVLENCRNAALSPKYDAEFQAILVSEGKPQFNIVEEVEATINQQGNHNNFLHLSVIKSPQSCTYPHVSFVSPWKESYISSGFMSNSLVLGHLQRLKIVTSVITLQLANKQEKISGFVYFSNDYELLPLRKYHFHFKGNKKVSLRFADIESQYVVIVLSPHEDRLIELSNINAFGTTVQGTSSTSSIKYEIPAQDLTIKIYEAQGQQKIQLAPSSIESSIINSKYDLSFLTQQKITNKLQQLSPSLLLKVRTNSNQSSTNRDISLQELTVKGFRLLSVNTVQRASTSNINSEELRVQFNNILNEYLLICQKNLLQALVSDRFVNLKLEIKGKQLKEFIINHVARTPFNADQKLYIEIFINLFANQLCTYKSELGLQSLITQGLKDSNLTAFGLQLLLHLNKVTKSINVSDLLNISLTSLRQIKEWKSLNKQNYNPYEQKSIFSTYIHQLFTKEHNAAQVKNIDGIHQKIVLKKHKFNRKYVLDFYSVHSIRSLDLIFQETKTKNKMVVTLRWVDQQGKEVGFVNHFVDYAQWTQLVQHKNAKLGSEIGGTLTIDLSSHNIQTRYLIIDCNFTLRPLNGSKAEIQSLADRDIIPIAYGTYIGQQTQNLSLCPDFSKNARFICKTLNFSKYSISNKGDHFYYQQEELRPEVGDLASLADKLELKENKDKWVRIQMNNPKNDCIDFHFTIFCSIADHICKLAISEEEELPEEWIRNVIDYVAQDEYLPIQELAVKALKYILNSKEKLNNVALNCQFKNQYLVPALFKSNPLTSESERRLILQQLQKNSEHVHLARNCLSLIKSLKNQVELDSMKDIGVALLKLLNNSEQQICQLCNIFGWIEGTDAIFQSSQHITTKRILAKASRSKDHLIEYLKKDLAANQPNDNFWIILQELINKGVEEKDLKEIVKQFLKWIVDIKVEDESDVRVFGLFERLIKVTDKVKFSENVAQEEIKIYFGLENRIVLLSEFLKSALVEENYSLQALLEQVINEVISLNSAKPNRSDNEEQLSFLADVLSFVYKTEDSPFQASPQAVGKVYGIIADFLNKFVNFGGVSGCRHLKESQINSIVLAHYLTLTFSKAHQIKSADFAKLVNWYIINFSSQVNNESNALKKFRLVHSNVWNLLVSGFSDPNNASLVAKALTQILDETKTLKDNKFLASIYQSRVYAFLKQVLKHFDDVSSSPQFLNLLLKNSNIFRRILEEIKEIKVFESNQNALIAQKELVNELKFLGEQKPKDWLEFKNVAKQHAFTVEFSKGNRQFKSLTFQSNNLFWLSQAVIGFSFNANVLAPKEITLQIGESLETMKLVGSLEYIPLESYLSQSVKVYAINLHRPSLRKWHLQRNITSRYVRLIIKSPYSNALFQSIDTNSSTFKENSLITFLSLSGYQQNGSTACPNDVHDLVQSLEVLSLPRNKTILEQLLNVDQNLVSFQQSLLNLSYLMGNDNYGLKLHKFLMRVCELNTSVGNKMLQEYLQLKNPYLSSKIAAQIAGSNLLQSGKRAAQYFEFIIKSLDKTLEVLPFVNKFTQLAAVLQKMHLINSIASQVHIQVDQATLRKILQKAESTPSFRKLLRLILTKRKPFIFEGFSSVSVYEILYHTGSSSSSELLASIIASEPECTTWFVDKSYLSEIFKAILSNIEKTEGSDAQLISNRLSFLTILCQNSQLKDIITKSQYDLKIFEILVGKDGEKLLSDSSNKLLRERLVEFIGRASLGTQNERIIGTLLKDSLGSMVLESSQQFVAEIFLPLLNSYSKTAISLLPFNKAESRLLTDLSGLKVHSANEKTVKKTNETFKLASHIIEDNQKTLFFDKLRENTQHKWGAFKLVTNHGKAPSFKVLEAVRKDILRAEKSALILIESKKKVGFFFNYSKDNQINNESIGWNRGSFAFQIDEKGAIQLFSYVYPKESLLSYERIIDQYEKESDVLRLKYKGRAVADIYFDGINSSIYHENSFKETNSSQKQRIKTVQYWTFDSQSVSSYETVFVSQESFAQKLLSQLNDYTFFKADLKADNSLSLLREEPLYEFPSSITLADLKRSIEIFGYTFNEESLSSVKIKNIKGSEIKQTDTLQALAKKNATDDLVLDLLLETDTMPSVQAKTDTKKIEYLPRKGILKYFQENDGVKAMIKVIKKSIGEWKNQARKQKWEQYVVELENFSTFPHFFSTYLKDKDTFKMLIDLLAGLPDKETDTKWDQLEVASSQKLLKLVSDILAMDSGNEFRNYALKNDFMSTILDRLRILTGIFKRKYEAEVVEEVNTSSPSKKDVDDDGTKKIKKKKGVGYGNDTNSNTKWMKGENLTNAKKDFENVETILSMVEGFLDSRGWIIPQNFLNQLLESSLLPYIEDCLRAGTLLQISKHPQKFKTVLKLIRSISKQQKLLPCLLPLSNNYQPTQTESIQSLLKSLYNISKIFLSCLNVNLTKEDKLSQDLANDIIQTYNLVEQAIQERDNIGKDENEFNTILSFPLDKKYRELMKDLRFDYIDMKESPTKIKHHYASNFNANYTPNHNKMIRLAQELADISTALPHEHTNAVYVRCDKDRVDFMQALIMGSNGTPYGHGAFLFDVYFDDNYPNGPPKVNLTTTGHGKIRFNPNLYSCGKVCLSLLGTWRGSASENWDAKVSTLLQVLLSIQAIIMSEEVYFNEPGFENEQGTEEGEKKNEAYSNIVRYGNVKFAMLQNIKNPPKGFQAIIRRHFYLKKDEIMEECRKWMKYAQKRPANYVGLVNDHNVSWASQFKKSKTQYKEMLEKAIKQLEEELAKLPPPKSTDIVPKHTAKKQKKRKDEAKNVDALQGAKLQEIDVSYEKIEGKQLDINDEKVRDRWSRYIGAMGIDAVSKQSKADILIYGLGPFGLQVVKNIVLSGCRRLTLCDEEDIKREDLSGGFFYQQEDVGKKRVDTIVQRIRELNSYVKIDVINRKDLSLENIGAYTVVLASELAFPEQIALAMMCREKKVKFISADCRSAYCRLVNDYGEFTVLDKNGEEPTEVNLSAIQNSQRGLVVVLQGSKHPFEDGEAIVINHVQGMENLENKEKSINGTIHTVKVVNSKSFEIGDTRKYGHYIRNGTAKNIKTPVTIKFRPFQASIDPQEKQLGVEPNLEYADFSKMTHEKYVQRCFIVLDQFRTKHKRLPEPWSAKDSALFLQIYTSIWKEELEKKEKRLIENFSFTCSGHLPPLCAFFGGLAAQEIIKAITQKYKPINSSLYLQFTEIIPQKEEGDWTETELSTIYKPTKSRDQGFTIVVGNELTQWIKQAKLFMIGAGAIGCELLKNLAMVGLGTGKEGKIVLTDPDHIQNSNLNRQFLFREKHISKPKSSTAAASVLLMNPLLKGHISALLERVSDSTKDIFSNKFFESLTVVANALDNVAARRYVDQRCVENKVPLFESGTLGPKGHVQVIIPYQTQSYGSQNDPIEDGEIPHCTLKMFPEETLHCIEWARDNFGKKFTLQPKALAKFLEKGYKTEPNDIKYLNESITMVTKGPRNFEDCITYAVNKFYKYYRDDVMQLLYTYPLDAKTKNGEPFWRLPKRPPAPIKYFNPEDLLHCTFVTSMAVLLAKVYQIPFPQNFRSDKERFAIGKAAAEVKIHEFVPSDEKAKAILKETFNDGKKEKSSKEEEEEEKEQPSESTEKTDLPKVETINSKNEQELYQELLQQVNGEFSIKHEEFQKDDDSNGHIDFIYSMANLRAINYKLDPMDWMTTRIKAGRIVPALATTTSCVAGLQTLEICKYLKKIKIDRMRNSYLNLAVPSLQMSEPGQVKKTKVTENLTVTLWDRWEVQCNDNITFGQVYAQLNKKYGLFPKGVLQGMSRIDLGKTEEEKKAFLALQVLEKLEKEDNYIDIVVLFTLAEGDDKILEGLPPVRLLFKK